MATEMLYRIDPKSGNKLSSLGFGCMRFPNSAALREELITTPNRYIPQRSVSSTEEMALF